MNSKGVMTQHKRVGRKLILMLVTVFVVMFWMVDKAFQISGIDYSHDIIAVRMGKTELCMVMVLLLLNVLMAYALLRNLSSRGKKTKFSLSTILTSMLALCLWLGYHFLPHSLDNAVSSDIVIGIGWFELWLATVLVLCSSLGILLLMRRVDRTREIVVMSAYSKKIHVGDKWVSIEEYLEEELGIQISHGITPEERDQVMAEFKKQSQYQTIPYPQDGDKA